MVTSIGRRERFYNLDRHPDQRTVFERDRDRILFTSAFRRLAGVTQVVSPLEGHVYHNRLTHTLEVAQLARRIAQKLGAGRGSRLADALGGLDPEVAEGAGLAHDLGHPPFGHAAEQELDHLLTGVDVPDGFEGNAQTFRILCKLAVRYEQAPGLNLTRASLNGVLKYPWLRTSPTEHKWNAYESERTEFQWVRLHTPGDARKSVEAEIMDWSDDVAYAVHDLEDFYRAGLIPLDRLVYDEMVEEHQGLFDGLVEILRSDGKFKEEERDEYWERFEFLRTNYFPLVPGEPYRGTLVHRAQLRGFTAALISRYVDAISLNEAAVEEPKQPRVTITPELKKEVDLLKQFNRFYVINNSTLIAQQRGQLQIIRDLFDVFHTDASASDPTKWRIFPEGWQDQLRTATDAPEPFRARSRVAADFIASMTEQEAIREHQRVTGIQSGLVRDAIVR